MSSMDEIREAVKRQVESALDDVAVHTQDVEYVPASQPVIGDLIFVAYRPHGSTIGWTRHPESGWWSKHWTSGDTPLHQPYVTVSANAKKPPTSR